MSLCLWYCVSHEKRHIQKTDGLEVFPHAEAAFAAKIPGTPGCRELSRPSGPGGFANLQRAFQTC